TEDAVPIGHITNGVHVPSWLAPQMFRLYDRHLGTGWHLRSSEAKIWDGIDDVDDGELWETHFSLKSRMIEFVRRRAVTNRALCCSNWSGSSVPMPSPSVLPAALPPTSAPI